MTGPAVTFKCFNTGISIRQRNKSKQRTVYISNIYIALLQSTPAPCSGDFKSKQRRLVRLYRSGRLCVACSQCKSQNKKVACVQTSVFLEMQGWGFPGRPAGLSCTKAALRPTVKSCGHCTGAFHGRSARPNSPVYYPCAMPVSFAMHPNILLNIPNQCALHFPQWNKSSSQFPSSIVLVLEQWVMS